MSNFYQYDTRGASAASQIINLQHMVEKRDAEIERLRKLLDHATKRIDRLLEENKALSDEQRALP